MGRKGGDRRYQFVDALVEVGGAELVTAGMPAEQARDVMLGVAQQLCARYARTLMYIPTMLDIELTRRDQEIWEKYGQDGAGPFGARKYTSARVAELAVEYQRTTVQIYNIVRLMHQREVGARQGQLPGLESEPGDAPKARAAVAGADGP